MKKLKNKIFFTIYAILSLFLLTILFIFHYQDYYNAKTNIERNLFRMNINDMFNKEENHVPFKENLKENIKEDPKRFLDVTMYTIFLDEKNEIIDIISHTENGDLSDNVQEMAQDIIEHNDSSKYFIGNLYFNQYSYRYEAGHYITIIDHTEEHTRLLASLKTSILLFLLLEIVIIFLSNLLSKWIIKPVCDSFEKQKQFIADASHELKTPLSVIMASSESIKETKNNKKWLDNIKLESVRMNKLITSLLDLAKLEEHKNRIFEKTNISKEVLKTILTMESLIYEKNIALEYHIDEDIFYNCNGEDIKQLVTILLDNAIQHSKDPGNIIVTLKEEKMNILLEVKNKGDAILKGEEEKIFERFYRSDQSRTRKDDRYGLGLAIAKSIVSNYQGKISASSSNSYTTFQVILKK